MLTPAEKEEITAVRDSDGRGLPREALIASQKYLAAKCLELDAEVRMALNPGPPPPIPTLDQLLPDRHKPHLRPPDERGLGRLHEAAPMETAPWDEASPPKP